MDYRNECEPVGTYTILKQVTLLGDSIFDNAPYVEEGESVSDQLQALFQNSAKVHLLAVDGHVMADISDQLTKAESIYPLDHVFLTCGGNDLLGYSGAGLLAVMANSIGDALNSIYQVRENFRQNYQEMLDSVLAKCSILTVCTIYDKIPNLSNAEQVAVGIFNEVILREAKVRELNVLDLRTLCDQVEDFSPVSPIEPSKQGAAKIASAIYQQCMTYSAENNI
ncbi:GDSL-lilke lipase/acylhydrolase family protein [Psychromonas ingrahamii 37]|uniref:GDSL-lilke lipase/acylhydrolase family protein n=1 Tax=Psychromonas ingrahamii (strain DSM 17664 / CCUG 51855 / 37) TaxID=357804 RepID=A1SXI6_PSYIN|nr:SGNH/GDSL hydrolase family protein [Psychromonas ingrahamii]ABM04201.1 GDSL-lilke lipase/acylhydrolase family protein [Psychromonas ingrahamii 37]